MRVPGYRTVTHHVRVATRIAPGRPAIWLGLRTAAATAIPLALSPWLDPVTATWAPLAGFGMALVDKGGAYRTRASNMALAAAGAFVAVVVGSLVAGRGPLAVAVVTLGLTACALGQAWGAAGASIGNTIAVQLIVAASLPIAAGELVPRAAGFLLGAAIAMFLSLVVWPVRVYKPGRRAVAGVLEELARHAAMLAAQAPGWRDEALRHHRVIRDRLELARATLAATRGGRRGESGRGERLLAIVELCDRLLGTVVGLEDTLDGGYPDETGAAIRDSLENLAAALDELADRVQVEARQPPPVTPAWDSSIGDAVLATLDGALRGVTEHALVIVARAHETRRLLAELVDSLVDDEERVPAPLAVLDARPSFLEQLRAIFDLDSDTLRHGLRVCAAALLASTLANGLQLRYGYWVTMTVYLLLQPNRAATTTRAIQRVAGTVGGAAVAAAVTWAVRDQLVLMVIIVALAGVGASMILLNGLLFALFLTPTFVLLAEVHTQDFTLVELRVANTAIGGLLALAAGRLLWPTREDARFREHMAAALDAAARYVGAVATAVASSQRLGSREILETRRRFGLALNNAELALERVVAERPPAGRLEPRMAMVSFTRRLGGAVNAFGTARAVVAFAPHASRISAFAGAVRARLDELAAAVRAGTAPGTAPRLDTSTGEPLIDARLTRIGLQLEILGEAATRSAATHSR